MAAKYTDMANRRRLALRAIGSIERDESVNVLFPHIANVRD